ncbi:hypothetical protein T08_6651 [Trichinella sp. T8]|nr:hypothetical protein T08_6651 [Trichinella sp. T8]
MPFQDCRTVDLQVQELLYLPFPTASPRWTKSINPLLVPATPANAPTWLPGREPFGAWLIEPYHRVNKTAPRFFQTVLGSGECSVR